MIPPGKLLTVEQSRRLAMLDKLSREQAIAEIVRHLQETKRDGAPRQWYTRRML